MADQHRQQWNQQQYPPQGYNPQGGPPPPQGGYGQPPYQQPPPGQYGQYGQPPPGQYGQGQHQPPPGQQQYPPQGYNPQGGHPPPHGGYGQPPYHQPPPGQYGQYGQPPPGQYGQPQHQPPPGQYPPQGGQHSQPPPGQYGAPQGYGAPPPGQYQQQYPLQQQQQHYPPTPPSLGYDASTQRAPHVDLSKDIEVVRKAMKGFGCDEKALTGVFTKISNPWTMQQFIKEYNSRFMRDLHKDIESETRGDFEEACMALLRTPLEQDVKILKKSLVRAGTDEEALMDVLLCRSNADLRIIAAEYKKVNGQDLLAVVKEDVDDTLDRFYSMVLKAQRAEDSAPVLPHEIDQHVTELQRATEGTIGVNAISVAQVFTSCNDAQLRAMVGAYEQKYHRKLENVIEKEFSGDMEDALMRMLLNAIDKPRADARLIHVPLNKAMRKDTLLINRLVRLYWDKPRLEAAKAAYKKVYAQTLASDIKEETSGDYEKLLLGIIGEK